MCIRDRHGTAIIVLAGVLNALKVVGKRIEDIKIVQNGPGAAGTAIIHMLQVAGAKHIIAVDEHGILVPGRPAGLEGHKAKLAEETNPEKISGSLAEAIKGADLFIGTSIAGALTPEMCIRDRANSSVNTGASSAQSQKMDAKINSTMQNTRKKPL